MLWEIFVMWSNIFRCFHCFRPQVVPTPPSDVLQEMASTTVKVTTSQSSPLLMRKRKVSMRLVTWIEVKVSSLPSSPQAKKKRMKILGTTPILRMKRTVLLFPLELLPPLLLMFLSSWFLLSIKSLLPPPQASAPPRRGTGTRATPSRWVGRGRGGTRHPRPQASASPWRGAAKRATPSWWVRRGRGGTVRTAVRIQHPGLQASSSPPEAAKRTTGTQHPPLLRASSSPPPEAAKKTTGTQHPPLLQGPRASSSPPPEAAKRTTGTQHPPLLRASTSPPPEAAKRTTGTQHPPLLQASSSPQPAGEILLSTDGRMTATLIRTVSPVCCRIENLCVWRGRSILR